MGCHWLFLAFVDLELKNIRSRVVPYDVQIIFPANNLRTIYLGDQNRLTIYVRACKKIPEGVNDTAPAARHDTIRVFAKRRAIIRGKVTPAIELVAR